MSRNLRNKSSATGFKQPLRRNSASEFTDDDYDGVDLVSDDDEDEPDVESAEEKAIIESEEDDSEDDDSGSPRPSVDGDEVWEGFASTQEVLGDDDKFFDDHMARMNAPDHDTEATAWNVTNGREGDKGRRVRFDLSDSSSGDSDSETDLFPDIFLEQSSLDPGFRRAIEHDDYDNGPSSEEGYWDFHGSEDDAAHESVDESDESTSTGSSEYETDEGETTEEDLPTVARHIPPRSVLRRASAESSDSEEDIPIVSYQSFRQYRRKPPTAFEWVHDDNRPFAVLASDGKRILMYKAKNDRPDRANDRNLPGKSSVTPANTGSRDIFPMSPMISDSANVMLSALYSPTDQMLDGQALGPPEAFYPFTSISADGTIAQDTSSYDEDDLDELDLWNLEDFVNFGAETSDDESGKEDADNSSDEQVTDALSSTPLRPSTARSDDQVHPLLSHFDSGVVGAFRRNQSRHALLSRNTASRESLAFSGPYRQGTIRGIKGGRLAAANTPITPVRKQRPGRALSASSPGSPLAAPLNSRKRKSADDDVAFTPGHKRNRSNLI